MNRISFKVNDIECTVGSEITSDVMLLDYVRNYLELRGTKYMCRQGGCGACIVSARRPSKPPYAINSCLIPVTACHGLEITTIEGIGNRKKGYHPIQKTLAASNGSQCGYCSPGWIMALYSLLHNKKDVTKLEIEQSFGSNICRCTGYRPILDAFKKFAVDANEKISIPDIEDLEKCNKNCENCDKVCDEDDWCLLSIKDLEDDSDIFKINLKDGKIWYKATTLYEILEILKQENSSSYKLICGNTAKGVYPNDQEYNDPKLLIDISGVQDLKGHSIDQNLVIGAGSTLTELLDIFELISKEEYFSYLRILYDHVKLVAHIAVASIAGNLMIKHKYNEFQSDIFLLFETVGAQLTLVNTSRVKKIVTMQNFLQLNMNGNIILNIMFPPLNDQYKLTTFKIMPRAQNAHAIVHAGFLYKFKNKYVVEQARIVFGGLSPKFIRASSTERYLNGRPLFTNTTLQVAIQILQKELIVTENLPEPSVSYRKKLALALFYKGLLTICPTNFVNPRFKSAIIKLDETREVSNGTQVFDTDRTMWPINQPIPKLEGLIQCAGEAMYTDDIPTFPKEVHAAFVLSTVAKGRIASIDVTDALKYSGVITCYTAKDIPGLNSFVPADGQNNTMNEEVFCSGDVKYYNQPLALIVAKTQYIANVAVNLVKVKYTNIVKPVIDIKDAIKDPNRTTLVKAIPATNKGNDASDLIKGGSTIYGQYHFTMETIVCVTTPTEEGLAVYTTSQWLSGAQLMISRALKLDQNRIDVYTRRLGGAFGFKLSRSVLSAVAASLVTSKLNHPCRIIQTIETNTRALGKRFPCSSNYEVHVNKSGVIQYADYNIYEDNGYVVNEQIALLGTKVYNNCYNSSVLNYKCFNTLTDTAKNTLCRSPGTLENIAMIEMMMEHISYKLSIDPIQVRLNNLYLQHKDIKEMFETLKDNSDYVSRKTDVNKFNAENRWKKRGIRFSFLRWQSIYPEYFDANLAVYQGDGTVIISHGGVEIGQGINTKAAQVAAYMLNIPIEKIIVKENSSISSPNSAITGASLTTQNTIVAVRKCCKQLLERLAPIRRQLNNPPWEELIKKSFEMSLDLQVHGFSGKDDMQKYQIYGVTVAEVEIDVLTGEHKILRVDALEDVGRSMNPALDVGQVEGAYIMGTGYWTCEKLVYDHSTGELLTDRTWNYYVPQARDIPIDFRVFLRQNSYSTKTLFGAKASSEPAICMSISIPIAIREAIAAAREESGIPSTNWFVIDGPYTTEEICLACDTKIEDFKFW